MTDLRVAVIGYGEMGRRHARVYNELPGVRVVAVVEPTEGFLATSHHLIRDGGIEYISSDVDSALRESNIRFDAASICTPTALHAEIAKKLIERGVHVLIEKPVASTVVEADALLGAWGASARGVVAVGHIERFNPAIIKLEECLLAAEEPVFELHAERVGPWPTRIRDTGVGLDLMTHDIDLALELVRDPLMRVHAESTNMSQNECTLSAILRFRRGAIATLHSSWLVPRKMRQITVTTRKGHYVANLITQELFFHENTSKQNALAAEHGVSEGNVTGYHIERQEPLRLELQAFVNKCRGLASFHTQRLCSLAQAREVLAIATTLRHQAQSVEGL